MTYAPDFLIDTLHVDAWEMPILTLELHEVKAGKVGKSGKIRPLFRDDALAK
jgi:hypothetical protein